MKTVREIYDFFLNHPTNHIYSLEEFMKTIPEFTIDEGNGILKIGNLSLAREYYSICRKMCDDLLLRVFHDDPYSFVKNRFEGITLESCSDPEEVQRKLEYGDFDYKYRGFTYTRNCFKNSVCPIVGIKENGDEDIGTCYYIGDNRFVTAAHCVRDFVRFKVLKGDNALMLRNVKFAHGEDVERYDLAVIEVDGEIDCKPLELATPSILDDVLTMGYPRISGYDAIQIAETATIGAYQKAAEGQILGDGFEHVMRMDSFLINARVKGGNSGSPVINREGRVVGTLVHLPMDDQVGTDNPRYDLMGYGACLPSKYVTRLLEEPDVHEMAVDGAYFRVV